MQPSLLLLAHHASCAIINDFMIQEVHYLHYLSLPPLLILSAITAALSVLISDDEVEHTLKYTQ